MKSWLKTSNPKYKIPFRLHKEQLTNHIESDQKEIKSPFILQFTMDSIWQLIQILQGKEKYPIQELPVVSVERIACLFDLACCRFGIKNEKMR